MKKEEPTRRGFLIDVETKKKKLGYFTCKCGEINAFMINSSENQMGKSMSFVCMHYLFLGTFFYGPVSTKVGTRFLEIYYDVEAQYWFIFMLKEMSFFSRVGYIHHIPYRPLICMNCMLNVL
jgi:hypothetical protein